MKPTLHLALASVICYFIFGFELIHSQELNTAVTTENTYHNQLFYNRYLLNPTFSLVRENKSYLNILHRNQYATFDDNRQNYYLGFSTKINANTAMGVGIYSQWSGVIQQFGFNANYAKAVQLSTKSKLTFGANITYFNEGIDKSKALVLSEDIELNQAKKESKVAIQPAITLSLGNFDFGVYAHDLIKYNQTTNAVESNFNKESVTAFLQYSHHFKATGGLFENARLMPLTQIGQNNDGSLKYRGAMVLNMPNYGWVQTTYDNTYGMSMGVGFNLNQKLSLGYVLEKDILNENADLGWNHEVSLAYTYKNDSNNGLFENASQDAKIDGIVRNYEEQINQLLAEKKEQERAHQIALKKLEQKKKRPYVNPMKFTDKADVKTIAEENRLVLDELILRQDSIEAERTKQFEKRFEIMMRTVKNEIKTNLKDRVGTVSNAITSEWVSKENNTTSAKNSSHKKSQPYNDLPLKFLGSSDMIGVKSGYYVIANVFKTKKYLKSFMTELKDQGLEPKQFYNKNNGLYYVYLADYNFKEEAESAYVTNLQGRYKDEKWIMQVDKSTAIVQNMFID